MSHIKAGVIGAGVFGGHHARKYQADARVDFVGVYDLDAERAQVLAKDLSARAFESIQDLIDAVEIVTIASPPATHASAAKSVLECGRHVLIEKPIATSVADAEALIATAEANKLVLACGHQERLVFDAMGLFSTPEKPVLIESVREGPWSGRSADVSVALDLMVHDFDLALTLMGAAPDGVSATGRSEHGAAADLLDATLSFGAAKAHFTSSRIAEARKRTMRLVYPSGEVKIDFLARSFENAAGFPLNANFAETPAGRDPLGHNVARFVDAVIGDAKRPAVNGAEALAALKLALAVDQAAGLPSLSW